MRLTYPAIISAMMICVLLSCKKGDSGKKSVGEFVNGKAWSGDIKYTGDTFEQPYYMEFHGTNSFQWTEARGAFGGTYTIDDSRREVKLTFSGGSIVTFTIDKKGNVSGITNGGSYGWAIQNMEQNSSTDDVIDNTNWKGIELSITGTPSSNCSIAFNTGSTFSYSSMGNIPYSRTGAFLKYFIAGPGYSYYMVINKNKIKGARMLSFSYSPDRKFEVTKQ